MAEPPAPAKPGKPGKPGAGLKRKLGPLPVWAWLALAGGAVLAWYLYGRRSVDGAGAGGGVELVTGRAPAPMEAAYGGYPSENGALAGQVDPSTLQAIERAEGLYAATYEELRGSIKDIEDALEGQGWSFEDQQIRPPSGPGSAPIESYDPLLERLQGIVSSFGGVQRSPTPRPAAKAKPPRGRAATKSQPKPSKPSKPRAGTRPPKPAKPAKAKPAPKPAKPRAVKKTPPKRAPARPVRRGAGGTPMRSA